MKKSSLTSYRWKLPKLSPGPPGWGLGVGSTAPHHKNYQVTDTQANTTSTNLLGDGRASFMECMMDVGQTRKVSTNQTPRPSIKSLRIASWNVRTMCDTGRSAQLSREMQRYKVDILGISETHWIQSGQKRLRTGELVLPAGREDGIHAEGVALVLGKLAQKTLRGWEQHGPRIVMASFTTKSKRVNMNVVQIYAPTEVSTEDVKEDFYSRLQAVLDKLPKKDVNIVMGDANAKIGADNTGYEDIMGKHGLGTMNNNGERLANMCAFNRLVIGGSIFPHKRIHKATWISPDGCTENQIDHFCIAHKFRRSLEDVRVLRGADIGSDHHLLLAKIKIRLKYYGAKSSEKRPKYQVNLLGTQGKQDEFKLELKNRFQLLEELVEEDVEAHWTKIKEAFTSTCQVVLGEKRVKHKPWITQESLELIETRRTKKLQLNESRTRSQKLKAQEEYNQVSKEVKRSLRRDKEAYLNKLAEKAEKAANSGQMRTLYQTTKTLSGKFSRSEVPVKDKDGRTVFEKEAQKERWVEHFKELLNRPPPTNPPDIIPARKDLPINCDPPTRNEIEQAVKLLSLGKSAGPDNIPPEALKMDTSLTTDILHGLFDKIWKEGRFPKDWKEGHLVKLPKKGDLSNCNNYRGITLLSIPGKVFNRIILERIKTAVDNKLREEQAGFRKNRSTTDQIATLRIIVEQSIEWKSSLIVNFIDYEKAFDSLDRKTLWKIMRHYGIPSKLVQLVEELYEGSSCRVVHDGQLTDSFDIITGVKQGCILSPFLFILAIDWLMKETTSGSRNGIQWTLWTQLEDLDFADDLALLSHTQAQMQEKTTDLDKLSRSVGLHIHPRKSKIFKANTTKEVTVVVNTEKLEEVDSFIYLGSVIDRKGGTEADIKSRIGKARTAFLALNKIWKDRKLSMRTKLRLFNSNVKSVLLYGSETWAATQTCIKRLQTFINGCLRRILRIRWTDKVRNEEVWKRTEQEATQTEVGRRRWRWIGHTLRKTNSNITRKALQWNPQGTRTRGRPRGTWRRVVVEDMERSGQSWNKLQKLAQDRAGWKVFVCGLYPGRVNRQ